MRGRYELSIWRKDAVPGYFGKFGNLAELDDVITTAKRQVLQWEPPALFSIRDRTTGRTVYEGGNPVPMVAASVAMAALCSVFAGDFEPIETKPHANLSGATGIIAALMLGAI